MRSRLADAGRDMLDMVCISSTKSASSSMAHDSLDVQNLLQDRSALRVVPLKGHTSACLSATSRSLSTAAASSDFNKQAPRRLLCQVLPGIGLTWICCPFSCMPAEY